MVTSIHLRASITFHLGGAEFAFLMGGASLIMTKTQHCLQNLVKTSSCFMNRVNLVFSPQMSFRVFTKTAAEFTAS